MHALPGRHGLAVAHGRCIQHGQGQPEDLAKLDNVAENIMGRTICALGDAAAMPVRAMLKHFRHEFAAKIEAAQKHPA